MERQALAAPARGSSGATAGTSRSRSTARRRARALPDRSASPTARTWASSSCRAPHGLPLGHGAAHATTPGGARSRPRRRSCSASRRPRRCSSASRRRRTVVDLTAALGALTIAGPAGAGDVRPLHARSTCARRSRRSRASGPARWRARRAASCARPSDRWLVLFGAALGAYMWTVVADAAATPRRRPVGVDACSRRVPPIHA